VWTDTGPFESSKGIVSSYFEKTTEGIIFEKKEMAGEILHWTGVKKIASRKYREAIEVDAIIF